MKDERWDILINYLKNNRKPEYRKLVDIISTNLIRLAQNNEAKDEEFQIMLASLLSDYDLTPIKYADTEYRLLNEDWNDCIPAKILLCGTLYTTRSWSDVLHIVCNFLYELHQEHFINIIQGDRVFGEISNYITRHPVKTKRYLYDKAANIYIAKDIHNNTVKNIIVQLLDAMGVIYEFFNFRLYPKVEGIEIENDNSVTQEGKQFKLVNIDVEFISDRQSCPQCKRTLKGKRLFYKRPDENSIYPVYLRMCTHCNKYYLRRMNYDSILSKEITIGQLTFWDKL